MFTPEHIHVMINHLPIIGIGLAIIPFLIGYIQKNRNFIFIAIIITFISSISVPIVFSSGAKAVENFEHGYLNPFTKDNTNENTNRGTMHWIEEHEEQAEIAMIPNYTLIILSIFALMYFKKENKISNILNITVFSFVIIVFVINSWVGLSGGKIRHPEFRDANQQYHLIEKDKD